jgi:hypothetical protein
MNEKRQHPLWRVVIAAIGYALIPVFALTLAGAVAGMADAQGHPLSGSMAMLVQIVAMLAAIGAGMLLARRYGGLRGVGFARPGERWLAKVCWLAPIVAVEAAAFLPGLDVAETGVPLLLLAAFCAVVGVHEELYFRGLVATCLRRYGWRIMAGGSALLFGIGHAAQALSGAESRTYVIAQIGFAFLFGIVALEIVALTGSLWPAIVWHAVHDFIAIRLAVDSVTGIAGVAYAIQTVILVALAIVWWKPASRQVTGGASPVERVREARHLSRHP